MNHLYFQQSELSSNRTFFLSVLSPIIPHDCFTLSLNSLSFVSPLVVVYLGQPQINHVYPHITSPSSPSLALQPFKFGHGLPHGRCCLFWPRASQHYHFFQDEVVSPMLNPQPRGPGFDVGVCFPWEVGKLLRNPPYPLEGHSLPIQLG